MGRGRRNKLCLFFFTCFPVLFLLTCLGGEKREKVGRAAVSSDLQGLQEAEEGETDTDEGGLVRLNEEESPQVVGFVAELEG